VLLSDFDYHLPAELIAQESLSQRDASRLLHLDRASAAMHDRLFRDFPELLRPDDLVVFNNSRVFPARLYGHRSGARAQPLSPRNPASRGFLRGVIEVLLTRQLSRDPNDWEALVRPGRKIGVGEQLSFGDRENRETPLRATVIARGNFGERRLRFAPIPNFFETIEQLGHVPLPPYIARPDSPADRQRYQTVYARERGSVAAPTAGLHFTPQILDALRHRGIETAELTLHVGLGTFQPVHVDRIEDHKLHSECYSIPAAAAAKINRALAAKRRVVAVGTTTVRALEHAATEQPWNSPERIPQISPVSGEADIFIYPGYAFRIVSALLTNFHLPRSSLLMLVSAFSGREFILRAYAHAVAQRYRFYSYGDCMFIV